ncbi:SAM-dependent methyltransferase [Sinorhizobium sp. BG8]|uniref:SAM-dependent methyltransferase n=1 Tax=Sinorhizobium sp. BG8 TaxID=2613773 RepID=UPI001FF055C5|nr:SAM-dependent methyltransferase [Sinorhizobium sp. BG8]
MMALSIKQLSDGQRHILTEALANGSYRCDGDSEQKRARSLNSKGLLSRDPKDGFVWSLTDAGRAAAGEIAPVAVNAVAVREPIPEEAATAPVRFDASDLTATVLRARALLDDGDVIRARILAEGAYEQAKAEARFAEKFGAAEQLVAKARQLQGDALLIETRAKILISSQWGAAQEAGTATKGGRPKTVSDGNGLRAEDTGLSRKEIHEARKLAAAEERSPGIVERAIMARVAAGLEPSRANLRVAVGTQSATKEERGNNLYETPPEAMHTLLALETFLPTVLEPACGRGAISGMLEAAGYDVILSDLVDYGTADQHGEVQVVADFLLSEAHPGEPDIVTNPPMARC